MEQHSTFCGSRKRILRECRFKDLNTYAYRPLEDADSGIRLLSLAPGSLEDPIKAQIHHARLKAPEHKPQQKVSLTELQNTLPAGWVCDRTHEGRIIFSITQASGSSGESLRDESSWTHPDRSVDPASYQASTDETLKSTSPKFEALSYVWGSPDDPDIVVVEDSESHAVRKILITRNLAIALRHLRYEDRPRTLWVDAVCINQRDDGEKASQVARMDRIYKLAFRVVVFLGSEDESTELGISTLEHLGKQLELAAGNMIRSPTATEPTWYKGATELPYSDGTWTAINRVLRRAWFFRMWTLQEIVLANTRAIMPCGSKVMLWSLFRRAIICLYNKTTMPLEIRECVAWMEALMDLPEHCSILRVVHRNRGRLCSNPHDKVYGLFGLFPESFRVLVGVDYSRDVSETFKVLFLAHIEKTGRWDLFGCDWEDRETGGPSWVPDLVPEQSNHYNSVDQLSSGYSKLCYTYSEVNRDQLRVMGVRCAVVQGVGERMDTAAPDMATIRSWEPEELDTGTYVTGESLMDAYARTLLHDEFSERSTGIPIFPSLLEWKNYAQGRFWDVKENEDDAEFDLSNLVDDMLFERCGGRSYMTTDEGFIGLGPAGVDEGDLIAVVLGCDRPLVLRPLDDDTFILVGDAYVYGLHDARPFLGPLPHGWRVQLAERHFEGYWRQIKFINEVTGEVAIEDPRLEPLSHGWERVEPEELGGPRDVNDSRFCTYFRNTANGDIVDYDPRMLPDALEARGVNLETFVLV